MTGNVNNELAGRRPRHQASERGPRGRKIPLAAEHSADELELGASSLIYGRRPVVEALKGGEVLARILVAHGTTVSGTLAQLLTCAASRHVPVEWVPRAVLDRAVAGFGSGRHQGVVALAGDFPYVDLLTILATALRRGEAPFILALDALQDVHNLAGLIRTAVAVGVHGVLIPEHGAVGITPAVRKASAGAVAHIAVARVALPEALDELHRRGVRLVGLDMAAEFSHLETDWRGPVAVVVGNEARGLRRAVARRCDQQVRVPMIGPIDSLNANVSGSVVLYEVLRQRMGKPAAGPQDAGRLV